MDRQCSGKLETPGYLCQPYLAEVNLPEAALRNARFSAFNSLHLTGICHLILKKASELVRAPVGLPESHRERTRGGDCVYMSKR